MVKEFDFFVRKGDVRKQKPDHNLSKATLREGVERLAFVRKLKAKPKYVLENAYEAMREAADALLYHDGYKSYSHEASILYCGTRGFAETELRAFDRFRNIRNGIKYYGRDCTESDARDALALAEKLVPKIQQMLSAPALEWNGRTKRSITSLKELLDALVKIKQEDVDSIMSRNKQAITKWIGQNFPKQLEIIVHLENKESTPQQMREQLVRDLRKIIASA
jgi:uncharacterized protein (UPF0332 family)